MKKTLKFKIVNAAWRAKLRLQSALDALEDRKFADNPIALARQRTRRMVARAHPAHFDMRSWASGRASEETREGICYDFTKVGHCGSTACLAGFALAANGIKEYSYGDGRSVKSIAADLLGLDGVTAYALFMAKDEYDRQYLDAPKHVALAVLDRVFKDGVVTWAEEGQKAGVRPSNG